MNEMLDNRYCTTSVKLFFFCLQEGVLNKLQSSVESEAKKWQEKLKQSEANLAQVRYLLKLTDKIYCRCQPFIK